MSVRTRLAGFAALLGVTFGVAALAGAAIDPTEDTPAGAHGGHGGKAAIPSMAGGGHHAMAGMARGAAEAGGLAASAEGLTLHPERTFFTAGQRARLRFAITDAKGRALGDEFEVESARRLHFIVVRRDTAIYQHLHPVQAAGGSWTVQVTLPQAGVYRAYADFQIAGRKHVLATDLFVPGAFAPNPLPTPSRTGQAHLDASRQPSGEQATLTAPGLTAGRETMLTFAVSRDGRPVADLQPYLGAKGHLVALRQGDLAYLHVHPDAAKVAANEIQFMATFPTAGTYRLFLQFQRAGKVRTVAFTLAVSR